MKVAEKLSPQYEIVKLKFSVFGKRLPSRDNTNNHFQITRDRLSH